MLQEVQDCINYNISVDERIKNIKDRQQQVDNNLKTTKSINGLNNCILLAGGTLILTELIITLATKDPAVFVHPSTLLCGVTLVTNTKINKDIKNEISLLKKKKIYYENLERQCIEEKLESKKIVDIKKTLIKK